ncbi:hypothetical protein KBA27_05140 [bacterium]|nr:hypothetical protein [bacterium]
MEQKFIPNVGIAKVTDYLPDNDELLKISEFEKQAEKDIEKIKNRGGKRLGAGRKLKTGFALSFQIRVSEQEKEFIKYAREHHLNYKALMTNAD